MPVLEKKKKGPCVEPATKIYSNVADVLIPNVEKVLSNGSEIRVGIIIARGNGDATSSIHKVNIYFLRYCHSRYMFCFNLTSMSLFTHHNLS